MKHDVQILEIIRRISPIYIDMLGEEKVSHMIHQKKVDIIKYRGGKNVDISLIISLTSLTIQILTFIFSRMDRKRDMEEKQKLNSTNQIYDELTSEVESTFKDEENFELVDYETLIKDAIKESR